MIPDGKLVPERDVLRDEAQEQQCTGCERRDERSPRDDGTAREGMIEGDMAGSCLNVPMLKLRRRR